MEHREIQLAASSRQKAAGREKRKEEKDFPVGAAFQPRL
jgi:hypothetical protein